MKAIIIGGSGATGKFLVKRLLQQPWISEVKVLLRKKTFSDHPKLSQIIVDFDRLDEHMGILEGDIAFSCLGTTLKAAGSKEAQWRVDVDYQLNFAKIARLNNVPVLVLLSAQNANIRSFSFYSKMKGKLEEEIEELDFEKLIILQPSILIRPDSDRTLEKLGVRIVKALNKMGILKNSTPIEVETLAKAMIKSVSAYHDKIKRVTVKEISTLGQ